MGYFLFAAGFATGVLYVLTVRAWRTYQAEKRRSA